MDEVRFDEALKQLLQFAESRLVEVLAGAPVKRWLNVEFAQTQLRRVDLLAELENGELFHVELQSRNDAEIAIRMLEYRLMIRRMYGVAPAQMVLYVGYEPVNMNGVWEEPNLRFACRVMDIRDFDPEPLRESSLIEDRILAILCRAGDSSEEALRVLREISELPHPERGDALAKLLVISGLRRLHKELRQEVEKMPLFDHPLENPFLLDLFLEGRAKGLEEGKAEGKAEGRVEGKAEGLAAGRRDEAARFLVQILEHRFGTLPESARVRIRQTPPEHLEKQIDRVLEAPDLQSALDW